MTGHASPPGVCDECLAQIQAGVAAGEFVAWFCPERETVAWPCVGEGQIWGWTLVGPVRSLADAQQAVAESEFLATTLELATPSSASH